MLLEEMGRTSDISDPNVLFGIWGMQSPEDSDFNHQWIWNLGILASTLALLFLHHMSQVHFWG